jgi:hypothetical protein
MDSNLDQVARNLAASRDLALPPTCSEKLRNRSLDLLQFAPDSATSAAPEPVPETDSPGCFAAMQNGHSLRRGQPERTGQIFEGELELNPRTNPLGASRSLAQAFSSSSITASQPSPSYVS